MNSVIYFPSPPHSFLQKASKSTSLSPAEMVIVATGCKVGGIQCMWWSTVNLLLHSTLDDDTVNTIHWLNAVCAGHGTG